MTVVSLFVGFYQVSKNRIALFLKKPCILKIKTYLCTRNTEVKHTAIQSMHRMIR